jgi:hypothetical protein
MKRIAVALLLCTATASADTTIIGHVTAPGGGPVDDATVYITGEAGLETVVKTDKHGAYRATVHRVGAYAVMFAFGSSRSSTKVTVGDGGAVTVDGTVGAGDEVIEIHDTRPVNPKPLTDPDVIPKYSDEAILSDKWTKAWLLLDVSERGDVTRVKFLKRPGLDLDDVAVHHAFEQKFEPARDEQGRPARSYVVWPIEWPSYWWLQKRFGVMTRLPKWNGMAPLTHLPPCAGSGPLALDSIDPVYRDCSKPDLSKADASERWLTAARQ